MPSTTPDPYERVAQEINAGVADQALWTRSWAEAGGDANRAMAVYIRLRAAQVQEVYREADRIAQEAIRAAHKADRARAAEQARIAAQRSRAEWWEEYGGILMLIVIVGVILFVCSLLPSRPY